MSDYKKPEKGLLCKDCMYWQAGDNRTGISECLRKDYQKLKYISTEADHECDEWGGRDSWIKAEVCGMTLGNYCKIHDALPTDIGLGCYECYKLLEIQLEQSQIENRELKTELEKWDKQFEKLCSLANEVK